MISLDDVQPARPGTRTGPRVAVLGSLNIPGQSDHVAELVIAFTSTVLQQIEDLDGDWTFIDTSADPSAPRVTVSEVLTADAVVLLGGGDVDSELYGVPGPAPHEYGVDRAADDFCIDVIRGAVDAGIPVLGICRGSQLLNVAFGGSLVPDIVNAGLHHGVSDDLMIDEAISVVEGTRLHAVLGCDRVVVRSGHHQAVDQVAPALRLAALAEDGVVEGVEHPEAWAVGVQWHPEDDDGPGDHRHSLFFALLAEAQQRRTVQA